MAAIFGRLAANPKIMSAATNAMKDPKLMDSLTKASSSVVEKFSNSGSNSASGTETITTVRSLSVGLCRVIAFIWDKLKILFSFLFLTRSPAAYVAWLIIIILIILAIVGGVTLGKRRVRLARNPNVKNKKDNKQKPKSSALSDKPTNEGWRRRAVQQTTDAGNVVDGYKRNELSGGRCDGLNWISDPKAGSKNCIKNLPPKTIRWELNSDEYQELNDLPQKLLNEDKQLINVPYTLVGDRFYADCSKMTYNDNDKTPVKLFIQKNIKDTNCQFIEKSAISFTDEKRKKEYKDYYTLCAN